MQGEVADVEPKGTPAQPDQTALRKIFHALANEHRLRIFRLLATGTLASCCGRIKWYERGCCVSDFVQAIGLSQPTVSHHLAVLEEAGLVRSEKRGLWTCFFPDPQGVRLLAAFVRELESCCPPVPGRQESM